MRKQILIAFIMALSLILLSGSGRQETNRAQEPLTIGTVVHGFKLEQKQFIKELDGEGYLFRHLKSGARLLKVASQDDNKVFSVAFKTPPPDDTGVPHIMEHSVLNGSENFPVKSPFDVLAQGSLKTFLNAMTSNDYTIYPVASRNDKDFANLMHVYLDAAFKPLIHKDPRILQQEGWHYELESPEGPLSYKGVVYNEMKGAYSAPERQLDYLMNKALFPDNCYGNSSGGRPEAIPQLTYEQFKAFHRKYYHPANSYIYVYGNGDMEKELAFIDGRYLSGYDKIDVDSRIPLQKPLAEPKLVRGQYGIPEGTAVDKKTLIARNSVYGLNTDQEFNIALDVLAEALVNHQAAPLRLALQKAGIGRDVSAYADTVQQPVFGITVTNAEAKDLELFDQVYRNTLKEVVAKGFDRTTLEGIINLQEFRLREGRGSYTGVLGAMMASSGWMFADNPFITLSFNKELAAIRSKLDQKYFEQLIEKVLLNNSHVCTVVMEPKPGLEKELATELERKLAEIKAKMSPEETARIVTQTKELIAYQQRKDDPEALKTIPLLEIADIEKKQEDLPLKTDSLAGTPLFYFDTFTKGIVYLDLYFDASAVDQEFIPYVQLYGELVGLMSTDAFAYGDLENQVNLHTGGIVTSLDVLAIHRNDEQAKPYFLMRGKAMPEKAGQLIDLMKQQLLHSKWDDDARLKELLLRTKAQFEQRLAYNGLGIAMRRLGSYMSNRYAYQDLTSGFGFYQFLCGINREPNLKKIAAKLKAVQAKLVNQNGLTVGITCQNEQLKAVKNALSAMLAGLPKHEFKAVEYRFAKEPLNEGFQDASKVQYVIKGSDYKKLGFQYNGKMNVLNQLLSTVYLQNTIRVQGGAYGGFAIMDNAGFLAFASYRDPNLKKTVENYLGASRFLSDLILDERDLRRLIIGTISGWDRPLNPNQKGYLAVRRYLVGDTLAMLQKERDEILGTTAGDLKGFAKMVEAVMAQNNLCVVGNEKKIADEKELFKKILPLRQ
ncbi:MAG: insulinase family protein [Candidatus Aminicenantes bacterium]|nr:insulinase family protein [Candidatus Aminicenantes bacterium]